MNSNVRSGAGRDERLIAALIPALVPGPRPVPAPLPTLPVLGLPTCAGSGALVVGMARLDSSGRVWARGLLTRLRWRPGHRLDIGVADGAVVITSAPAGLHVVGGRGELGLPAAARQMCGITPGPPVVLAASVPEDLLVVHPAAVVARLLEQWYARLAGGRDAG